MWVEATTILKEIIPELNNIEIEFNNKDADKRGPIFNHDDIKICLPSKPIEFIVADYWITYGKNKLGELYNELNYSIFMIVHEYKHYLQFHNSGLFYRRSCKLISKLRELAEDQKLLTDNEYRRIYKTTDLEREADKFALDFVIKNHNKWEDKNNG